MKIIKGKMKGKKVKLAEPKQDDRFRSSIS